MTWRKRASFILTSAALLAPLPLLFPALLLFPHHARAASFEVWSETPIDQAKLDAIVADANKRLATSPLYHPPEVRKVFLTQDSWRWLWLANTARGSIAFTKPFNNAMIVNRSSIADNAVWIDRPGGKRRTLGAIIAHEACHGMQRRHFGFAVQVTKPTWLFEGYCDHVAQESTLSEADYAALKANGETRPAMIYYEGRKKVEAALAANGGDVDGLFSAN